MVNLDPDVEEMLRAKVREQSLDFDRTLNEAVRAGLSASVASRRYVQNTDSLGSQHVDLTKALALADDLEDRETIRKMGLFEGR